MAKGPEAPDPVELTRRTYAYLNSRDFEGVAGMFAADAVWDVSRWGLGTHRGLTAIRLFLQDWFGSLEEYRVEIQEMRDLGNGVVAGIVLQVGRPAGGLSLLRVRSAPVFLWVEGRIAQVTLYRDLDEGRAAAEQLARVR